MSELTRTQKKCLAVMIENGEWMLLSDIGFAPNTVRALVEAGLVEKFTVAGLPEYRAKPQRWG